jgi:hypothetical protein
MLWFPHHQISYFLCHQDYGSSIMLKLSFEMMLPNLSEKQLRFSEYVFKLKFEAKTNANNSPNAKGSKIMSYESGSIFLD